MTTPQQRTVLTTALILLMVWAMNLKFQDPTLFADLPHDQQNVLHWLSVLGEGAEWGLTVSTAVLSAVNLPSAEDGFTRFTLFAVLILSTLNLCVLLYSAFTALS